MYKRILSYFLVFALLLSMIPLVTFADEHQHTFGDNKRGLDMGSLPDEYSCPATFYETPCESLCGYSKYEWTFAGASDSFVDVSGLNALQVYSRWRKWFEKAYGASANLEKMDTTNAGANIPASGGRNPKGYGDEGKADVTSAGAGVVWAEPFGTAQNITKLGFYKDAPAGTVITGASVSGTSSIWTRYFRPLYYFIAPVTGLYYVGSAGSPYDMGTFSFFNRNSWHLLYCDAKYANSYEYSITLQKGEGCYFEYYFLDDDLARGCPYRYSLNNIPIYIEPLGDSSITTVNNITITNNNYSQTWNGNIYTDNSTNLTYIYPQYTTVNEKNETVTNISNTPIIYNNETKQYYIYDQTTKNYYYINYGATPTPTPAPTETPTPSPEPTEEPSPSPTPTPGGSGTGGGGDVSTPETGKPGNGSGSSWWDKLLSKIGDAIVDGLLGAVSAVLKLIFKLLSTILGWIIWAVSRVFDLLPFLPPGLGGLLVGGVVVCFVIGIIKFIRG